MNRGASKHIFVALLPNKGEKAKIADIQDQFKNIEGIELVPQENLHMTLIPPMNVSDLSKLITDIESILAISKKPKLLFNKTEYGVDSSNPRLVWLLGRPLRSNLRRLYKGLSTKLSYKSDKKFKPHITLAKVSDEVGELPKIKQTQMVMEFEKLAILESIQTESGQIYEPVKFFKL